MADHPSSKDDFIAPRSQYWGKVSLPNLTFNANLQEFAHRVAFVCNLETGGKISPEEAYERIRTLWKQLKTSKKNLLDTPPPDLPPDTSESPDNSP